MRILFKLSSVSNSEPPLIPGFLEIVGGIPNSWWSKSLCSYPDGLSTDGLSPRALSTDGLRENELRTKKLYQAAVQEVSSVLSHPHGP